MLIDRIAAEIAADGPMRFDRFMEIALYDPEGGYFATGPLRSDRQGDFLTSPEVSPHFGRTLGAFVAAERHRIGDPSHLIECGAGSGSLIGPLLEVVPGIDSWAVEVSPAAGDRLAAIPRVRVVASLEDIPGPIGGVILANELLDNLPAPVVVRRGGRWDELAIALGHDGLETVEVEARPAVAGWADRHAGEVAEGGRVEVQLAAGRWIRSALGLLSAGSVVVIDYGDDTAGLARRRTEGTLRTYQAHHLGPDPLLAPGTTDITMDVDFTALAAVAASTGATVEVTTQADFLERWGLRATITELRHAELAAAREGNTMRRLQLRSEITGAETLLHPRGLGDFRVLVATRS